MDIAPPTRALSAVAAPQQRTDIAPVREAVRTDLPQPHQSVPATERSAGARLDDDTRARRAARSGLSDDMRRELEREFEFDDDARDVVVRQLDSRTGEVVAQYPAEAIMRIRAYVREQEAARAAEPTLAREA